MSDGDYVCPRCGNDEEFEYFGFCRKYIRFQDGIRIVDEEFLLVEEEFYFGDEAIRCVKCGLDTRETSYFVCDFVPSLRRPGIEPRQV